MVRNETRAGTETFIRVSGATFQVQLKNLLQKLLFLLLYNLL